MQTDIYARLRDLAASAEAKPEEMRPILLRVTTDLFVLHALHTPQETRLYEEMAGKLIADADEASLILAARKLARCADAPASVLRRIRARGGAPAREILLIDTQIEWRELRQIAASGPCDEASAIAGRSDLDREITKILSNRQEREIARAVAANPLAPLAVEDLRLLCARGREDAELAQALLNRGDLTLDHLPLYLSADERRRETLVGLVRAASLAHLGRADGTETLDEESCGLLEHAASRQKRSSFALVLADFLGCDPLCARKIVDDASGDALTLAFISLGLPRAIGARIFLVAFPRVALSAEAFQRNLALFDWLPRRDAARIIAAIAGETKRAGASSLRAQGRRGPLGGGAEEQKSPARDDSLLLPALDRIR